MEEQNNIGWQEPPPSEHLPINSRGEEPAQMSEAATLGNIFLEPGRTFEDLRRKPRFILALLISIVFITAFQFLFLNKLGDDNIRRYVQDQVDKNPRMESLSREDKQNAVNMQMKITGFIKYIIPVFVILGVFIGALIYFLLTKAFGGEITFMQTLSVWVYSSFPPIVVAMIANIIVLFLKSADDIDFAASQRGLIHANPSFFFDGKAMPVITTIISTLDLFQIWGWILAAIGLHKVGKLKKGSAWAIVLIVVAISLTYRLLSAYMSGNAM